MTRTGLFTPAAAPTPPLPTPSTPSTLSTPSAPPTRTTLAVGPFGTVANVVTALRTAACVVTGLLAVSVDSMALLAAAYAVYWLGDIADGWCARRLNQQTRAGAVLDIVCDRTCTTLLCTALAAHDPAVVPAAVVFLLSFTVLDTLLSLAFLCWNLLSPNDFWLVDGAVWRLNWSPAAKALNTAAVIGAVAIGAHVVALAVAVAVVVVKVWSARRVCRLLSPC